MEIILAILILSVLILVHEWGHFVTAKKAGLFVEEFGIGLPPRLWGKRVGETIYSINLLPIGGFVKIYGENGREIDRRVPEVRPGRAFYEKPIRTRLGILASGVFMNFLLGIAIFSVLLSIGVPAAATERLKPSLKDYRVEIVTIAPHSPAEQSGIQRGDRILSIRLGKEEMIVQSSKEVSEFVSRFRGKEITLRVQRGNNTMNIPVFSRENPPEGEGSLGIVMAEVGTLQFPWWRSIFEAIRLSGEMAVNVLKALGGVFLDLFRTGKISEGVAGPIGIVQFAGEVARLGILRLLNFAALLSINLAVLNLLPIPALDGGRIFFLFLEKVRGRPVPRRYEAFSHAIGMAVLLTLILLISIQDIKRLF